MLAVNVWFWVGFIAFVLVMLALDLGVFHRTPHEVRPKEAGIWVAVWVALALAFAGGLYLWATRGEPCGDTVTWLAQRGILVAPGGFYGPAGAHHVRVALTASDERLAAAAGRLNAPAGV